MRLIAVEEAFSIPDLEARFPAIAQGLHVPVSAEFGRHVAERLPDFTEYRLPEMDRHGVDVHVLSLTVPGIQGNLGAADATAAARDANEYLAAVVDAHPTRFAGLAALPLQDPGAAVAELHRAVTELGLHGALVNDHTAGHYLDEAEYEPLWTALEKLDVPLYIHPGAPPVDQWHVLSEAPELIGPTWSWSAEAGAHALRLIYSGVFDRHPAARVVLGHMGEFLPFMLSRLDSRYPTLDTGRRIRRLPSEYVGTNVLLSISGVQSRAALAGAVLAVGADAIMFAIDYPYESTEAAVAAFAAAPISDLDRVKIAHGNAEKAFKLEQPG